ncbi:MAG: LamG-like jellyroll fold domain-containing protein, partial [Planctomycetota bacterium]
MCRRMIYLVSFVLVLVLTNFAQADLIGYWRFDESSGTIAADSAGGDNDGTLSENVQWQPDFGKSGGALLWDGTDSAHVEFPTTGMSATTGTFAAWGYLSEPQPGWTRYFFGHTTQPSYSNRIQLYMDNTDTGLDLGLGDSHARLTNIMVLDTEVWYHVALTWDNGNYVVYVNGQDVANGIYSGLGTLHPFAWIGNDGNPVSEGVEAFGGMLDEVQLYDHALNAAEILAAMEGIEFGAAPAALPEGWQSRDIGTTGGSAAEIDGTWDISADGADVWGRWDQFHYVFMPLSGDGTIVARVVDNGTGSDNWAKGGVMIRETLEPGSKHAIMAITGGLGSGKAFQHRPVADERSMSAHGGDQVAPPMWVRLTRVGNTFIGYYSEDGVNWIEQENWSLDGGDVAQNPTTIEMAADVYIGLFVTSHESGEIRTYTFDNVSVVKLVFDVTAPGDVIQGVPNDGLHDGSRNFGWWRWESPDLVIDDDAATKYLHFKGETETTGFQVTPTSGPSIVTGLTLTTANDFPARDPIAFELSGSNESINGPYKLIASGYIVDFAQAEAWPRLTM